MKAGPLLPGPPTPLADRREVFAELAARRAAGHLDRGPKELGPSERREYLRAILWEDHAARIANRPDAAEAKFESLAERPFRFFRGTALVFYRDLAGRDAHLPRVLCAGDVHPENFGVMPNRDGAPIFGINDFDEACFAPFSWDLMRGATGFWLAAQDEGVSKKKRRKVVRAFLEGYLDALLSFAADEREVSHQYRLDNSPPIVRALLESSRTPRREHLEKLVDLDKSRFRATDEVVPYSSHVEEMQKAIRKYVRANEIAQSRVAQFRVKDVALKKGSGTASLGLDRYWILLDGATDDPADDVVLELKQARRSALAGLSGADDEDGGDEEASRIVAAHQVHLVGGDPYYGRVVLGKMELIARERSPYKAKVDLSDLTQRQWCDYARVCGGVLAQSHARSDADTGVQEGDAEARILSSIRRDVFVDDLVRLAHEAARRVRRDLELYREDLALGAYRLIG